MKLNFESELMVRVEDVTDTRGAGVTWEGSYWLHGDWWCYLGKLGKIKNKLYIQGTNNSMSKVRFLLMVHWNFQIGNFTFFWYRVSMVSGNSALTAVSYCKSLSSLTCQMKRNVHSFRNIRKLQFGRICVH